MADALMAGAFVKAVAQATPAPMQPTVELTAEAAAEFADLLERDNPWHYRPDDDSIYPRFGEFMESDWSGYGPFEDRVRIAPANVEQVRSMVNAFATTSNPIPEGEGERDA